MVFGCMLSPYLAAKGNPWQWDDFHSVDDIDQRYASSKAAQVADLMVAFQRSTGAWGRIPINGYEQYKRPGKGVQYDPVGGFVFGGDDFRVLMAANQQASVQYDDANTPYQTHSHYASSIDDSLTTSEIRFLLRVAQVTGNNVYLAAAERGIRYAA